MEIIKYNTNDMPLSNGNSFLYEYRIRLSDTSLIKYVSDGVSGKTIPLPCDNLYQWLIDNVGLFPDKWFYYIDNSKYDPIFYIYLCNSDDLVSFKLTWDGNNT